jgi:hypothetical protein
MVMHLITVLTNYSVGILVLDEVQHLSKLKDDAMNMFDLFVTLTNMFTVPILFIGTGRAKSLFTKNFRLARRIQSGGYVEMNPLKKESLEWNTLLQSLWDFNVLDDETELDEKMQEVFYDESQGIISLAVMLFMCSQSRALLQQKKKLTPALVKETAINDLKLTQPMITALRSEDPIKIAEFDDIIIDEETIWKNIQHDIEMEERVSEAIAAKKQDIQNKRQNAHDTLYFSICSSNLFPNLSPEEIRNILDTVVKNTDSNIAEDDLKLLVMERILAENQKKQQKKKIKNVTPIKGENVLKIYDDAIKKKQHVYDALKQSGNMSSP